MELNLAQGGVTLGPLHIRFYSLAIIAGVLAGHALAQREAARRSENPDHVTVFAVLGFVLGLVGARLYHVLDAEYWPYYAANPLEIPAIWNGGLGIFGAVVVLLLAARRLGPRLKPGGVMLLYLVWYPAARFGLEFLRLDPWSVGALTMAQLISLVCIVAALALLAWRQLGPASPGAKGAVALGRGRPL